MKRRMPPMRTKPCPSVLKSRHSRGVLELRRLRTAATSAFLLSALGGGFPSAMAGTTIITEAVDNFIGCNNPVLNYRISNAQNFRNQLLYPGSIFQSGPTWIDPNVWTTDFTSGDSNNMDQASNVDAIAFISTHGVKDWVGTESACASS